MPNDKDKAVLGIIGASVVLLLLAMCVWVLINIEGNTPSPPDMTVPNLDRVIGNLQQAKSVCEGLAAHAKRQARQRQLGTGERLYIAAAGAHNGFISRISAALQMAHPSLKGDELEQMLADADTRRDAFMQWHEEATGYRRSKQRYGAAESPLGDVVKMFELLVELKKLEMQQAAEQRQALKELLDRTYWPTWNQIPRQQ